MLLTRSADETYRMGCPYVMTVVFSTLQTIFSSCLTTKALEKRIAYWPDQRCQPQSFDAYMYTESAREEMFI